MGDRGVIYVATGRGYLDLAIQSAKTLKVHNPSLEVDLFTDLPEEVPPGFFDQVHLTPVKIGRAKIFCMPLSRFDRTLFLDCDTLVLRPLRDIFDLLDRFDVALAHDVRRASDLVREGAKVSTPYAFPQLNSGVMLFGKNAAARQFFADWQERYRRHGGGRDQVTLKDLLWESDIRFYVLPQEFNLRRVTLLDAWEPLDVEPTIVHSHRLLQHLRHDNAERVTTLDRLIELERQALREEWAAAGAPSDPIDRTEELLKWFDQAQSNRHN